MPQVILLGTALSIQAKRPTTRYGVINPIPIDQAMAVMLLRTSLSRIPRRATITSARVRVAQHRETSSGRTLRIKRITSTWSSKTTWRTRPSTSSIIATVEKGGSPISTRWVFDVTSTVQKFVDGTLENRGWEISMEETVALKFRGTPADSRPPDIVVEYAVTPDEPTNLHPSSGEISVSNPTLTFDADDEITALDVQIDPEANETAPAWDSGTIAATGGLLDLADPDGLLPTPYPGLEENSTTYWRVRQRNAAGWSDWSEWAQMTRTAVGTLEIIQPPSGDISDPTPTIGWTFDGVQTAWRVRVLDEDGDQLASSGTTVGTDDLWRPRKGFTHAGQTGYIVVDVWDDTDRVATPDQTEYVTATLPVTFTPDPTVDPVEQLEAVQLDSTPDVTIRGVRGVIADSLSLYRSIRGGTFLLLDTYDALDVVDEDDPTKFIIVDRTAPMNCRNIRYYVTAGVQGKNSPQGPIARIDTRGLGVWITDLETGDRAVIWGVEAEQESTENAIVHEPLNRTNQNYNQRIVRRRLVTYQPSGTIDGLLATVSQLGMPTAEESERQFRIWRNNDAGHLYQIHLGRDTRPVIIGDISLAEREENRADDRLLNVSFGWWSQAGLDED